MHRVILVVICMVVCHASAALGYRAAVVEHYPRTASSPRETIKQNLNEYRNHVEAARTQTAEIVVFPEYGLTTLVDDPTEYALIIDSNEQIIKELFDMAKEQNMYLVVNLLEKEQMANKATKYYNTNLVIAKNGTIVLKYRKINLYNEDKLTPGDANQAVTFVTEYGVTYGIFTCFDILFENPSRRVLDNLAVTDIVYPTAWISTMPFFTSLSVQHGYALANGVNLLAADYGKPTESLGGSGIYLASGKTAELYMSDSPSSKRLIQEIPKIPKRESRTVCSTIAPQGLPGDLDKNNVTDFKTKKDFPSSEYTSDIVDLTKGETNYNICNGDHCCNFNIVLDKTTVRSSEHYRVVAYDGYSDVDGTKYHLRICSLLYCKSDDISTCGERVDTISTRFTKITVNGNLKDEEGTFYVPSTLNTYLQPIVKSNWCNNKNQTNSSFTQLSTTAAQENVLVFGIIGKTVSAASSAQAFGILFLVVFAMIKCVVF